MTQNKQHGPVIELNRLQVSASDLTALMSYKYFGFL